MEGRAELLAEQILGDSLSETRVRAFDFSDSTRTEPRCFLTHTSHPGWGDACSAAASDLSGFLQEDPLPPKFAIKTYEYADSDPLDYRDPFGLQALPVPAPAPAPAPVVPGIEPVPGVGLPGPWWFWCLVLMQTGHDNRPHVHPTPAGKVLPFPQPQPSPGCCPTTP